jgi:poly(hydroxyalkanoate) depolymerase family esterase
MHVSLLAPLLVLLLGAAPPGGATPGPLPGQYFSGRYVADTGARNYSGYVPSGYREGVALPLVVVLHGCTQSSGGLRRQTKFDDLAEAKGFIVLYPEQPTTANPTNCWNWFNPKNIQRDSAEPSIIAGVTDMIRQRYMAEPQRIYLAGFSAGAAMAAVMGATYPDRYAAIGIGSGIQYGGPNLDPADAGRAAYRAMGPFARPMPTLIFHGGVDDIVPVANAERLVRQWQTTADLADDGTLNATVPAAPRHTRPEHSADGRSYTVTRYDDRQGQELMQYWLVPDMGHAWSGGCACSAFSDPGGPDETIAMYTFFETHHMDMPPSTGRTTPVT